MRTEEQKQKNREYMRIWRKEHPERVVECRRRFSRLHPGCSAPYMLVYRRRHPEKHREQNRILKERHNAETQEFATRSRERWEGYEVGYLSRHALNMTAREIAFVLERSYCAVILQAFKCHIPMMTEDKRHGRLVTR